MCTCPRNLYIHVSAIRCNENVFALVCKYIRVGYISILMELLDTMGFRLDGTIGKETPYYRSVFTHCYSLTLSPSSTLVVTVYRLIFYSPSPSMPYRPFYSQKCCHISVLSFAPDGSRRWFLSRLSFVLDKHAHVRVGFSDCKLLIHAAIGDPLLPQYTRVLISEISFSFPRAILSEHPIYEKNVNITPSCKRDGSSISANREASQADFDIARGSPKSIPLRALSCVVAIPAPDARRDKAAGKYFRQKPITSGETLILRKATYALPAGPSRAESSGTESGRNPGPRASWKVKCAQF